jgi:hypothetical protein
MEEKGLDAGDWKNGLLWKEKTVNLRKDKVNRKNRINSSFWAAFRFFML